MNKPTLDEAVALLRQIRDKKAELDEKYRRKRAQLVEWEETVSNMILHQMQEQGLDAVSTPHGRVQRVVKETPFVTDWDAFQGYVLEHGALHLLHRRISTKAAKEILEAGESLPGVAVNREYVLRVQKPTSKKR